MFDKTLNANIVSQLILRKEQSLIFNLIVFTVMYQVSDRVFILTFFSSLFKKINKV